MDQSIKIALEQIQKSVSRDLKQDFDSNELQSIATLESRDKQYYMAITVPQNVDNLIENLKKATPKNKLGIIVGMYEKELTTKLNEEGLPVLYAYELEHGSYTGFIGNYFLVRSEGLPSFEDVLKIVEQKCTEKPEYYNHEASRILARYRNFNYAYPIWSDEEMKLATWEIEVFNSVLKAAKESYGSDGEFYGSTFAPISTYKLQDGTSLHNPDLNKLKQENGLGRYLLSRFHSVNFILIKRRYLEFLLFMNSNEVKRPDIFFDLLELIEEEVCFSLKNVEKYQHLELHTSKLIHRYIELIGFFKDPLLSRNGYLDKKVAYINNYINTLWSKKSYRWILDVPQYIRQYPKVVSLFSDRISDLIEYLEVSEEAFRNEGNPSLQQICIEEISELKKLKNEEYDTNIHLAEVKFQHAMQMVSQNSYLGATSLIEQAISLLKNAKVKSPVRIEELKELHKKWAKLAPKEMKKIEAKVDYPREKIEEERNRYISTLKDIPDIETRVRAFFSDSTLIMSESSLKEIIDSTKNSLSSLFSFSVIDEIGTVKKPTNDLEQAEMNEYRWYGTLIHIYIDKILILVNRCFTEGVFKIEDIESIIMNSLAINEDDKLYLKECFSLFKSKKYIAFVHIAVPMLERFFRNITEDNIKHKSKGVEYTVSLDDMISESVNVGFPSNIARFLKYFYTRRDGENLRNNVAHSFSSFNHLNHPDTAFLVFWSVMFCYINLEPISDT